MRKVILIAVLVILGACLTFGDSEITPERWAEHYRCSNRPSEITQEELPYISFIPCFGSSTIENLRANLPIATVDDLEKAVGRGKRRDILLALYDLSGSQSSSISSAEPVPDFVFREPAQVIRIIDADTFVAYWQNGHKERIRPAGWDAPELKSYECFAVESTVWISNLLLNRWIWLAPVEQPRDRYGRVLAKVYLDSSYTAHLGKIMVSQGFAEAMEEYPTGQELQPLEEEARAARRGIWGNCPYEDP